MQRAIQRRVDITHNVTYVQCGQRMAPHLWQNPARWNRSDLRVEGGKSEECSATGTKAGSRDWGA